MRVYEIAAYQADGELYCPDCWAPCEDDRCHEGCRDGGSHDVTGVDLSDGDSCGGCGACWVAGEWRTGDDARAMRWSRCWECHHQQPWETIDADTRLRALRGQLRCECCDRPAVHF